MTQPELPKYPLVWNRNNIYLKVFTSIPELATGILLRVEDKNIIIDPGDGILRDLNVELGKEKILEIDNIFITHGHHDHLGGLWSLLTYMMIMKKKSGLNIYSPQNCIELKSIIKAFKEVYSNQNAYDIKLNELMASDSVKINNLTITPFEVYHREYSEGSVERIPSLGYKFEYDNKKIVYGGDTAYFDEFKEIVRNADLAIVDAGAGDQSDSEIHMNFNQANLLGKLAKEYFLVHVPQKFYK